MSDDEVIDLDSRRQHWLLFIRCKDCSAERMGFGPDTETWKPEEHKCHVCGGRRGEVFGRKKMSQDEFWDRGDSEQ